MGRISSTEDTSSSENEYHDAMQSLLPPLTTQPNEQASVGNSTPISNAGQRHSHRRNKTTVSNISEMLPLNPRLPSLMESMEQFGFGQSIASGREETQNSAIKQKPVLSSSSLNILAHEPGHIDNVTSSMRLPTTLQWQDSARNEDGIPDSGRARTLSEVSIDSTSTVADDTWNPVDTYLGLSSSDEELNMGEAVPLHAMGIEGAVPGLWDGARENMDEIPAAQLDQYYPKDQCEQAGEPHGVDVCDFVYVTRKIPSSAEEWDTVELVRKERMSDEVSLADTVDMSEEEEEVDQRALDLARREISHGSDREDTVLLGSGRAEAEDWVDFEDSDVVAERPSSVADGFLLPSTVYVPPEAKRASSESEKRKGPEERSSLPKDGALPTLPSTVYVPPTARLIAEDAGSIMDYASGSDIGGDDEASMPINLEPLTRVENNTVASPAEADNRGSAASSRDHTSMPRIKFQKTRKAGGEKQRRHSANVFRLISARLPSWSGSPHVGYSFQSPPQGEASQQVVSEPMLRAGVDVPVQTHKRHTSFARLLNKFKGKDGVKKTNDGTTPPKSLLRHAAERADDFIVRHNW